MSSKRAMRRKACSGKQRFATEVEARAGIAAAHRGQGYVGFMVPYRCRFCTGFPSAGPSAAGDQREGEGVIYAEPKKGQRVAWRGDDGTLKHHATVLRIEGNLCWIKPDDGGESAPFIWRFHDGLNTLAEIVA